MLVTFGNNGFVCTGFTEVAVVGEGCDTDFGDDVVILVNVWVVGEVKVTAFRTEVVDGRAVVCGKSFTGNVLPVETDFTVVRMAGVRLSASEIIVVAVVIIVIGPFGGTALAESKVKRVYGLVGMVAATEGTAVVVADSGPAMYAAAQDTTFGSSEVLEVTEIAMPAESMLVDADIVTIVAVPAPVTDMVAGVETVREGKEETWVDVVSRPVTARGEVTASAETNVDMVSGTCVVIWSEGAVGDWLEAWTGMST